MTAINDNVYVAGNFTDPQKYAGYVAQLLGDIFSHCTTRFCMPLTGTNNVNTGSISWTISNLGGNLPYFRVGANVRITCATDPLSWMLGNITALTTTTVTVNVLASAVNVATSDSNFTMQYIGGMATAQPAGTAAQNIGGLAQTTAAAARTQLGVGDPQVLSEGIFDDFLGAPGLVALTVPQSYVPERWLVTLAGGAAYVPNACKTYPGDLTSPPNTVPVNGVGSLSPFIGSGTYASHPGVCALEVTTANDTATLDYNGVAGTPGLCFPAVGDIFEICFAVICPTNYADSGTITMYMSPRSGLGTIGLKISATPFLSGLNGLMNVSLFAKTSGGADNSSPATPSLLPNTFYRATIFSSLLTRATMYVVDMAGNLVYSTGLITHGITQSTANPLYPKISITKTGVGSTKLALLLDYVYLKKAVSR